MRTLQCFQNFFFFAHKKLKKPPSKVAHNRPKPFIPQPSPTHSQQPKIDFSCHKNVPPSLCLLLCALNQCKLIAIKSRFALICRKAQEQKYLKIWGFFENWEEEKMSKFTFVLNFWPHDSWLGTLDHLAISLVDNRHKKVGKISKNVLLIFPLPSTVVVQTKSCQNTSVFLPGGKNL